MIILTPPYKRPTHAKTEGVPPPFSFSLNFLLLMLTENGGGMSSAAIVFPCIPSASSGSRNIPQISNRGFPSKNSRFAFFRTRNCRINCIISCIANFRLFPEIFLRKKSTKHLPCLINQCIIYLVKIARDALSMRFFQAGQPGSRPAFRQTSTDTDPITIGITPVLHRFLQFYVRNPSRKCVFEFAFEPIL